MITLLLLLILYCYPFRTLLSLPISFIFLIYFAYPLSFDPYLVYFFFCSAFPLFFPFFKLLAIEKKITLPLYTYIAAARLDFQFIPSFKPFFQLLLAPPSFFNNI